MLFLKVSCFSKCVVSHSVFDEGFRVQGLGFSCCFSKCVVSQSVLFLKVYSTRDLGFRVQGLGFRVQLFFLKVLQYVMLQRVAVCDVVACCSVLQRVAVCDVVTYCSVLQRAAVCCSVLQCVMLQRVAVCDDVACCSVLQRVLSFWCSQRVFDDSKSIERGITSPQSSTSNNNTEEFEIESHHDD